MFWKNLKISRKLMIGFGIVTLIMLSVIAYSYISFQAGDKALEENILAEKITTHADYVLISLLNMETGARGYALTGNSDFLEPYNEGKLGYEQHLNALKTLTQGSPDQQERLVRLNERYKKWMEWQKENMIEERTKVVKSETSIEHIISLAQEGKGKADMDIIRSILSDIVTEEYMILLQINDNLNTLKTRTGWIMSVGGLIAALIAMFITLIMTKLIVRPVKALTDTLKNLSESEADFDFRLSVDSNDEIGQMASSFNLFMNNIKEIITENENQSWMKTGESGLSEQFRGVQDVKELATKAITYIAKHTNAQIGAIYINDDDDTFKLLGSYAYKKRKNISNEFKIGEGLVGQCAFEKQSIMVSQLPDDYIHISSGLGEAVPGSVLVVPCIYNDEIKAIVEIGTFDPITDLKIDFIEQISDSLAMGIHSVAARIKTEELLSKTLEQSEELQIKQGELESSNKGLEEQAKVLIESEAKLQVQQEELRQSNEELEEQAKALMESEARLQAQQEELRVINEELEENTKRLELQKKDILIKNENLSKAQIEIEEKAKAVEITSKYKSEFLANMSHELRTPLNSILVLSQMLAEKKESNRLNDKQLEYATTIHSSGKDLLKLINDILDLSKVEAGKMDVNLEQIDLTNLSRQVESSFKHIAAQKGIDFNVVIDSDAPNYIMSDPLRVQQIINNLLSNALKFTEKGAVTFKISPRKEDQAIAISINDTGIGIPIEKQGDIFDAFKQSDGTTSRKYGGTGLGLSISKELANLLGGEIYLKSEQNLGSTFTLVLPMNYAPTKESKSEETMSLEKVSEALPETVETKEIKAVELKEPKKLLVLDNDKTDHQNISDLLGGEGIQVTFLDSGKEACKLLKHESFDCIIMDLKLKDMMAIDFLKLQNEKDIANIPVIIHTENILTQEEESALNQYAQSIVIKGAKSTERLVAEANLFIHNINAKVDRPKTRLIRSNHEKEESLKNKKILVIDDDMRNVFALTSLLEEKGIKVVIGKNGQDGIEKLQNNPDIDLILMDIMMPVMDGYAAMSQIRNTLGIKDIPIIALTAKAMKDDRQKAIVAGANDYLTKPLDVEKLISLLRVWLYK